MAVHRRRNRFFHPVIARNEQRIHRPHLCANRIRRCALLRQACAPSGRPIVIRGGRGELAAQRVIAHSVNRRIAQQPEGQGEIRAIVRHARQEIFGQRDVLAFRPAEAQLAAEPGVVCSLKAWAEGVDRALRFRQRRILVVGQQRQKRFGQTRQIPLRHARLVGIGIAALMVDGAEHRAGVIGIHKGAWPVIDGLARHRHIVGVHHTVNETRQQPLHDQIGLAGNHAVEEGAITIRRFHRIGIEPGDGMVGQKP